MENFNLYCIKECPIGNPTSNKLLEENDSTIDAAIDMQIFVKKCQEKGCKYQKEMQEFIRKNS